MRPILIPGVRHGASYLSRSENAGEPTADLDNHRGLAIRIGEVRTAYGSASTSSAVLRRLPV
jgi:hypothetical protein